jgi:hypothetical protein
VKTVVPMAIALSGRAEDIACHVASKDMDQDTGIGMIVVITVRGVIDNTKTTGITNQGDIHAGTTSLPSRKAGAANVATRREFR